MFYLSYYVCTCMCKPPCASNAKGKIVYRYPSSPSDLTTLNNVCVQVCRIEKERTGSELEGLFFLVLVELGELSPCQWSNASEGRCSLLFFLVG